MLGDTFHANIADILRIKRIDQNLNSQNVISSAWFRSGNGFKVKKGICIAIKLLLWYFMLHKTQFSANHDSYGSEILCTVASSVYIIVIVIVVRPRPPERDPKMNA